MTDEALNVEDNSRQSETEEDCSLSDSSDDAQDAPTLDSPSHSSKYKFILMKKLAET